MNFIKEYLITILLVFLILIVLFGFVFFIYKITNEYNNNNIDIAEIPENIPIMDDDKNIIIEEQESTNEEEGFVTDEEKDTQIINSTLNQIANNFNNCNASQRMRSQGYTMNAMATEDKITITTSGYGYNFYIDFILDDNILYTEIMYDETDPRISAIKVTLAVILVDCVGQVKGYSEGELSADLGEEKASSYTLENQGVEIKKLLNGKDITVRVDLNSNFSFLNS